MNDLIGPYGAVLVIRIWFESHPSPSTLRARILHADDPTRGNTDSVVVVGVQQTAEAIQNWVASYVSECQRHASAVHVSSDSRSNS
jgi:hypothetical protein